MTLFFDWNLIVLCLCKCLLGKCKLKVNWLLLLYFCLSKILGVWGSFFLSPHQFSLATAAQGKQEFSRQGIWLRCWKHFYTGMYLQHEKFWSFKDYRMWFCDLLVFVANFELGNYDMEFSHCGCSSERITGSISLGGGRRINVILMLGTKKGKSWKHVILSECGNPYHARFPCFLASIISKFIRSKFTHFTCFLSSVVCI